ncbi:MAG: right-handed parallel beta-helix repeat-containing protein [Thermodesulfobacteriota bacterium]|nr:right-handed parallel beta-helix repeat-containing protein [Thermodesulfobacteriota bacterium]
MAGVDLEVPIEMVDYGLNSLAGSSTTNYKRSWVYLDPADYHNATYYYEIVATNTHTTSAYNVYLRSTSTSTTYATISVPANTTEPKRFRSTQFTPAVGKKEYLVRVSQTPTAAQLKVFTARIIVQQTNADYSRIQIPMVHRVFNVAADGPGYVDQRALTSWGQTNPNRYCLWEKDESKYDDLTGATWTLETVLDHDLSSGTSYVALYNATTGQQVSGTEISLYGDVIDLLDTSFSNTAANFSDGEDFELRIRSSTTADQAELRRACLYVKLTNLTRAEVLYRVAGRVRSTTGKNFVYQRALVDTGVFTNPEVYFQASGWCVDPTPTVHLGDHGTNDVGTTGVTDVTGSAITFSALKTVQRTSAITITSGNRFFGRTENTTSNMDLTSAFVVITFPTASCATPGTPSNPSPGDGTSNQSVNVDLDWSDCTDTDTYDVYFGTSPSPPLYASDVVGSSYALPTLEYCKQYYWKIVAKNAGGCSTTGEVWDFTTEDGSPGTPGGPDPADLETGVLVSAVLDWSDCTSTDAYDVYLGTASSPPLYASDVTDSNYDPDLAWDTHYYWKIVAKSGCGSSTTSDIWEFTTGRAPDASRFVDSNNPSPASPYDSWANAAKKLGQAIGAASSGETVMVRAGTSYTDAVVMKNGVDLVAEDGVRPNITYSLGFHDPVVVATGPITCKIKGFDIHVYSGMGDGITLDGESGQVNATIEDCLIHCNNMGMGIRMFGTVNTTIKDCVIYDSNVLMRVGIGTSGWGPSDRIASNSSITIKGTTIGGSGQGMMSVGVRLVGDDAAGNIQLTMGGNGVSDGNTISHNGEAGMLLVGIDQVSMENNDVSNNGNGGVVLIDSSTVSPHIKNNTIHNQTSAAGINIGGASSITISDNNDIYANYAGIAFYILNNSSDFGAFDPVTKTVSSQPVTISGNNLYGNSYAGIAVKDGITGGVTITGNDIYSNRAGIRIQRKCTLFIERNDIHDNTRGGIHTGSELADGGGFGSTLGTAVLTIEKNKIYDNGGSGFGAGIDIRHASGTIYNNLVYGNHSGVRFGDYVSEIVNNTVVGNGENDTGGGIIYDDLAGAVNAEPGGTLNNSGNFPPLPVIRNNISAYNEKAGLRVGGNGYDCPTNPDYPGDPAGDKYRDFNLLYSNFGWDGDPDCGWPDNPGKKCVNQQYGGCGAHFDFGQSPPVVLENPNDIMAAPLFVSITEGSEDYHLQSGSPAENAGDDGTDMGAYGGIDPLDW